MAKIQVKFQKKTQAQYNAITPNSGTFYLVTTADGQDLYLGDEKLNNASDITAAIAALSAEGGAIKNINDTLTKLQGDVNTNGSIAKMIADAIDDLSSSVSATEITDESGDVNVLTGVTMTKGELKSKTEQKLKKVAVTGAAGDVSVADTAGNLDATTVEAALAEIITKINNANDAGKISIDKLTGSNVVNSNNVAEYNFYQGVTESDDATAKAAKKIGTIELSKDMVATDGDLVYEDGEGNEGTFIRMTIANGTPFYINVADLIEYNAVADTDEIHLIDTNHTITATIKKVSATKIVYKAAVEADPDNGVEAQAEQTVAQAINALESTVNNLDISGDIDNAINELDSVAANYTVGEDGEADSHVQSDGLKVKVTQADGVVTGVEAAIVPNTYDTYGAASNAKSDVIGNANTDTADSDTINGAKKYADNALANALVWEEEE